MYQHHAQLLAWSNMIEMGNRPPGEVERELLELKVEAVKYVIVRNALDGNVPLDEIPFYLT